MSHDAFGYLEKYGVHIAPLVGLSPDAEPTAAVIGELQELIDEDGITTVFSEPLEPDLVEAWPGTSVSGPRPSTRSRD